jgi:hypothetical protein
MTGRALRWSAMFNFMIAKGLPCHLPDELATLALLGDDYVDDTDERIEASNFLTEYPVAQEAVTTAISLVGEAVNFFAPQEILVILEFEFRYLHPLASTDELMQVATRLAKIFQPVAGV